MFPKTLDANPFSILSHLTYFGSRTPSVTGFLLEKKEEVYWVPGSTNK